MTIVLVIILIMIFNYIGITSAHFDPNAWLIFTGIIIHSLARELHGK